MMHLDFPFHFDRTGKTATTSRFDHVVDMLIQYVCTCPLERVNRPEFGTPLSCMCFETNSQSLADLVQFVARAELDRTFSEFLEIVDLAVRAEDATLVLDLKYRVRGEDELHERQRRVQVSPEGVSG